MPARVAGFSRVQLALQDEAFQAYLECVQSIIARQLGLPAQYLGGPLPEWWVRFHAPQLKALPAPRESEHGQ